MIVQPQLFLRACRILCQLQKAQRVIDLTRLKQYCFFCNLRCKQIFPLKTLLMFDLITSIELHKNRHTYERNLACFGSFFFSMSNKMENGMVNQNGERETR